MIFFLNKKDNSNVNELSLFCKNFLLENSITLEDISIVSDMIQKDSNFSLKDRLIIKRIAERNKENFERFSLNLNSTLEKDILIFIMQFDFFIIENSANFVWKKLILKASKNNSYLNNIFSNSLDIMNSDYSLDNLSKLLLPNKSILGYKEEFLKIKINEDETVGKFIERFKFSAKLSKLENFSICFKFVDCLPKALSDKIVLLFLDIKGNKDFGENLDYIITRILNFVGINDILFPKMVKDNFTNNRIIYNNNTNLKRKCFNCNGFGHLASNCKFRKFNNNVQK
jgi:hypothetical protein